VSTNVRPTTEPTPTNDPTTSATRDDTRDTGDATRDSEDATTDFPESGVALCQRQFSPNRTDRLQNLVDEENQAMADGV
jgi:hypothetical protein